MIGAITRQHSLNSQNGDRKNLNPTIIQQYLPGNSLQRAFSFGQENERERERGMSGGGSSGYGRNIDQDDDDSDGDDLPVVNIDLRY